MSLSPRLLQPGDAPVRALRRWLIGTTAGRAIGGGVALKALALLLGLTPLSARLAEAVETAGGVALMVGAFALVYRVYATIKDLLLWRVRWKLTLSYIFIGFVPAFLIIVLFLVSGLMLFFNVSQYMARRSVASTFEQAAFLAESAAVGLAGAGSAAEVAERVTRRQAGAERAFPFVSYAVVPAGTACGGGPAAPPDAAAAGAVITAGPWRHVDPPPAIPAFVECPGAAALIAYAEAPRAAADGEVPAYLAARAVAWPDDRGLGYAVVVDVPLGGALLDRVRRETGIDVGNVSAIVGSGCTVIGGRAIEPPRAPPPAPATGNPLRRPIAWVAFLDLRDWGTGRSCRASANITMTIADLYARISSEVAVRGYPLDLVPLFIGVLFLVIQIAALIMGLTLARSITGSIHELFAGTERVRHGDFTHKIAIRSRDQLGALAESFNSMTSSIEDLLDEKAEKERMEQELRIARSIQMSLLPHGGLTIPGLSVTAHCEPAREVGGDYYDYMPIDDHRVGLLIADVSGKGTSAALYMAELKGLMLALTQRHTSPRSLLIDANRIISRHLDTRSFITITYAVVDLEARMLTYARAGHCPLIHVPGPHAPSRAAQILAPDGLVLGLQIDNGERFEQLLAEASVPLGPGDLFLFYTDGLTDAMDRDGNGFGDARLAALLQEHADLPFEELRERILREVEAFTGPTVQQDDMTMLLLKVDDVGVRV